jgi:cellulose 1,4-beta-cellobiosidase
MFYLLNKELSFEVDVTACGCGMISALYFISMESDGGQTSSGYTGATYGTGYCDAQPAEPGRSSCDELDIWEANSLTNVYTTHPCLNSHDDGVWEPLTSTEFGQYKFERAEPRCH